MPGSHNMPFFGVICAIAILSNLNLSFKYMKAVRPKVPFYVAFSGIYLCFAVIFAANTCGPDCLPSVTISVAGIAVSVPMLYTLMVRAGREKGYPKTMSTANSLLTVTVAILTFADRFVVNWEGAKGTSVLINLVGFFILVEIVGVVFTELEKMKGRKENDI